MVLPVPHVANRFVLLAPASVQRVDNQSSGSTANLCRMPVNKNSTGSLSWGNAADEQQVMVRDERADAERYPCRLYAVLARDAPLAVILRRGPSKWVQVILWNTDDDTFTYGQWFHGRIYERRCDVSPDGAFFVYFASKITGHTLRDPEYTHAWTAISKPPYLTALALWPKGDSWDGGGLFRGRRTLMLNHDPAHRIPHPAHRPHKLTIRPAGSVEDHWPRGEDYPIHYERLERDGWHLESSGIWPRPSVLKDRWDAERPTIWQKSHPSGHYQLTWTLRGYEWGRLGGV